MLGEKSWVENKFHSPGDHNLSNLSGDRETKVYFHTNTKI